MQPKVIIHSLLSVDGRIEGLSPEGIGLYYQLAGRLDCDTWLVGCDTLLEAESLPGTEIHPEDRAEAPLSQISTNGGPLMVVPDSRGRLRTWHTHVDGVGARGSVALVSRATPRQYLEYLGRRHIPYIEAGDDHVDYRLALPELRVRYGSDSIQTDSGGLLNSVLLQQGLVTELSLLISPELVGDQHRAMFRTLRIPSTTKLQVLASEQVGEGYLWLRYRISN